MMKYKEYEARVVVESEHRRFYGDVTNVRIPITFEGTSYDELDAAFHDAIDDYLAWCGEEGIEPERPYSGKFVYRGTSVLHRDLATIAHRTGESLNSVATRAFEALIASELGHDEAQLAEDVSLARHFTLVNFPIPLSNVLVIDQSLQGRQLTQMHLVKQISHAINEGRPVLRGDVAGVGPLEGNNADGPS